MSSVKHAKLRAVKTLPPRSGGKRHHTVRAREQQATVGQPTARTHGPKKPFRQWTLAERDRWWRPEGDSFPELPLPDAKVSDAEMPAAKERAIRAVQEFGVWVEASRASGIGRSQLVYLLRKETPDPAFRERMFQARRECQERLEGAFIARGMTKGGDLAGIFYLKHNRTRYREVQRVELTGKDGSPLNALDAAKADLLARLGKLAGSREGLEDKQELIVGGSARPRLVKGSAGSDPKRSAPRKAARD